MQIVRLGGGTGGSAWTEHPVTYQSRQLYPWPGKVQTITNTIFVRLGQTNLYDYTNGYDKDRPGTGAGSYENPALSSPSLVTMQTGLLVINQT
jgi:hypothetical protein